MLDLLRSSSSDVLAVDDPDASIGENARDPLVIEVVGVRLRSGSGLVAKRSAMGSGSGRAGIGGTASWSESPESSASDLEALAREKKLPFFFGLGFGFEESVS